MNINNNKILTNLSTNSNSVNNNGNNRDNNLKSKLTDIRILSKLAKK
jgi:hypothetical protein